MQHHDDKYKEAVVRNISLAPKNRSSDKKSYGAMSLVEAKVCLGIRKDDNSFDDQVRTLIAKSKK